MDSMKDAYVAGVSALAAFLFWLSNYDKEKELPRGTRMRKLLFGMLGSSITSWVVFELLVYGGLPFRVSLAVSAAVAYLGGEVVSKLFLRFIERKLDKVADKPA